MYTTQTEEVPDVDDVETQGENSPAASKQSTSASADDASETSEVDDEAIVEDAEDVKFQVEENEQPLKMKTVVTEEWLHLNAQPPIWTR